MISFSEEDRRLAPFGKQILIENLKFESFNELAITYRII